MNPNYRTLNNDIGMVQRTNNGWDLWFDSGDLVKAEDFHSLQVGIIIACLTSWNYMNRYGNPTYEVFGNKAYQLLKANKSSMVRYKIQQFFIECLKRMRRVYEIVTLEVTEDPYDSHKYLVTFEVISISNQLVDGSFTISTDASKSTSYIEYNTYMPYASNENDLIIDLWLKNEYGGGLEGEVLYMYLKRGDGEYEFRGVVGRTDETGYLRVTYTPTESNENNVVYFDFHGNSTYNPSTSKRTGFKTELFEYHVEFTNEEIATYDYADLNLKFCRKSPYEDEWRVMSDIVVVVNGDDGKTYTALTDGNGEATVRVKIDKTTTFYTSYGNDDANTTITIIKRATTLDFTSPSYYYNNDMIILSCNVKGESDENISGLEVRFCEEDIVLGSALTNDEGIASLDVTGLGEGMHTITATIVENNKYDIATSTVSFIVFSDQLILYDDCSVESGLLNYSSESIPFAVDNNISASSNTLTFSTDNYVLDGSGNYFSGREIVAMEGIENAKVRIKFKLKYANAFNQLLIGCSDSEMGAGSSRDCFYRVRGDNKLQTYDLYGNEATIDSSSRGYNSDWFYLELVRKEDNATINLYDSSLNVLHSSSRQVSAITGTIKWYFGLQTEKGFEVYIKEVFAEALEV